MIKPSTETKIAGILLIFFPFFQFTLALILTAEQTMQVFKNPASLLAWGGSIVLFSLFGIGVLKCSWRMRLAAIIVISYIALMPFVGLFIAPLLNWNLFQQALNQHGANVVIWMPLALFMMAFGPVLVYYCLVIFFLFRPRLKAEFEERRLG